MTARSPLLLVDAMLGRLCKWLRLLGYDTVYASSWSDHKIAAQARAENRIVLTRDRELAKRKGIHCLSIHSQVLERQLEEVIDALGLPPAGTEARCPKCNALLAAMSPQQAKNHVPRYVLTTQRDFAHCSTCDKVYWPGSHWHNIQSTLERIQDAYRLDKSGDVEN
jgi:uncharacterized protein with PIN domain